MVEWHGAAFRQESLGKIEIFQGLKTLGLKKTKVLIERLVVKPRFESFCLCDVNSLFNGMSMGIFP